MKLHLCLLNFSEWSDAVQGYEDTLQFRCCTTCHKLEWRRIGYSGQVKALAMNEIKKQVLKEN